MNDIRLNDIHEAIHIAVSIAPIDGIARVFLRQAVDVVTRAMRLISDLDHVSHDFNPMKGLLRINDKRRHLAAHCHIARFAARRWAVDPHMRPVKITPDRNGMWSPIRIDRTQGAQQRSVEQVACGIW